MCSRRHDATGWAGGSFRFGAVCGAVDDQRLLRAELFNQSSHESTPHKCLADDGILCVCVLLTAYIHEYQGGNTKAKQTEQSIKGTKYKGTNHIGTLCFARAVSSLMAAKRGASGVELWSN